jgi:hypothetical protein
VLHDGSHGSPATTISGEDAIRNHLADLNTQVSVLHSIFSMHEKATNN